MSRIRRAIAGVVGGLALCASAASAAPLLTITPTYVGTTSDFTSFTTRPLVGATPAGAYDVIEIRFALSGDEDLPVMEDLAAMSFNINAPSGIRVEDFGSGIRWNPVTGNTPDINGAAPGGVFPLYASNADGGANGGDLQGIFVQVANNVANSRQYGEAGRPKVGAADELGLPTLLGTIYVQYDGQATSNLTVTQGVGTFLNTWINNASGTGASVAQTDATFSATPVTFVPVPEPASLSLLGLGAMALLGRRRKA